MKLGVAKSVAEGEFAGVERVQTARQIQRLLERHSTFWPRQLAAHPKDIPWLLGSALEQERTAGRLKAIWRPMGWSALGCDETFACLRALKRREMLRITIRDLAGYANLEITVAELSALADFCLQRALEPAIAEMASKHGMPRAKFAILGLGKLGGQELNYSSDIDLIFVYSEEGAVGRLTNHDFFTRVAERVVQGFRSNGHRETLFRVDLRLRPEGNSGPITRSLESYENYYAAFGEVWERMALQKARLCAGDPELGYEFIQHLQPFCFPKSLPPSALDEIFQIKLRIEAEILKEGGLERHVKLGRGGIREIEFGVQALQLLHGSRNAFSQERGTLRSLHALLRMDLLGASEAAALSRAYIFLRRLEHRLQMREDRQTHVVPASHAEQTALARGLGFKSHAAFEAEWKAHGEFVRAFFHRIVRPGGFSPSETAAAPVDWGAASPERDRLLCELGFREIEKASHTLQILARGPDYAHVSQRTRNRFQQLLPCLFETARKLARPDDALQQFERFIGAYGSRASLYELLASNPKILQLLLQLFDHSPFFTDVIVQQPALLEAIAFGGLLGESRTRLKMKGALAQETSETLEGRLRSFQRSELLRIALRDILGLSRSHEETSREISQLADVCLAEAVQSARNSLSKGKDGRSGFCVIALGKYGAADLSYGSDLDILFIGPSVETAARVIAIMSQERAEGIVFKMDARLRPDGEDGPLSLPLQGYLSYFRKRAQLWERQSLTRARMVAGDRALGAAFLQFVRQTIYAQGITDSEWKEIWEMRSRIEKERGDPSDPVRDFKTGAGGLVDIEFLVQAWQLRYGWKRPSIRGTSTFEILRALPGIGIWRPEHSDALIQDYLWLRKLESILRRSYNTPISQLPSNREDWEAPAKHLGLSRASDLETELKSRRKRIRNRVRKLRQL